MFRCLLIILALCATRATSPLAAADDPKPAVPVIDTSRGDRQIADYFRHQTELLAKRSLADIRTLEDWTSRRGEYRRQLFEMLGLDPLPERTPLKAAVTGKVDHELFTVEKVQFQSRPGLYVTGNLYVPKNLNQPAPAILYVCGHSLVKKDGVAFGAKTYYQHHGGWFARNGYVCLTIDTLQLGELEGIHHGTYNKGMWWWNSLGYCPAGVEAWNCIRALDYLQTRSEVDGDRIGVTGRSGGGAYSWWIAALDDRIKVAVPVAGITDLQNHVVDGTVEGHCDCMFMLNTYRWDFAQVAALVAPRPLLISNTDKDTIFPLEGVVRVYQKTRDVYRLYDAADKLGLQITEGPHKDTQELHIHAFRWFNRFLKNDADSQVTTAAVKFFTPEQLKVFESLPTDEQNTTIHESFVPTAPAPSVPESAENWKKQRAAWLDELRTKSFRGWPDEAEAAATPLDVQPAFDVEREGIHFAAYDLTSQRDIRLRLYVSSRAGMKLADAELLVVNALDPQGWTTWLASMQTGFAAELGNEALPGKDAKGFELLQQMFKSFKWVMVHVAPRGVGPTAWDQSEKKQVQHRRRFMLLGQTLDGMRVWDIRRTVQAVRTLEGGKQVPVWLQGERDMAGIALYAALFEPDIARLDLWWLPQSHQTGPEFLNVLKILDLPAAVAMAAENSKVRIYQAEAKGWEYPQAVAGKLGWDMKQIQVRALPKPAE